MPVLVEFIFARNSVASAQIPPTDNGSLSANHASRRMAAVPGKVYPELAEGTPGFQIENLDKRGYVVGWLRPVLLPPPPFSLEFSPKRTQVGPKSYVGDEIQRFRRRVDSDTAAA